MTHLAAICNQKGGVGKTTLTINLGAALAQLGQRVLLLDLDPQGHLTEGVGLKDRYLDDHPNLYDALTSTGPLDPAQLLHRHVTEPFWVAPSHYQLMLAEQTLFMARNREHKLAALVARLAAGMVAMDAAPVTSAAPVAGTVPGRKITVRGADTAAQSAATTGTGTAAPDAPFDWVLIDCPPSLGNLTDNALNAARQVIVPIQAEATSLRALDLLFDQIESVERGLGVAIDVLAVVPNLVQDSAMAKAILADLRATVPAVTPLEVRKRVLLQQAWSQGVSVFGYQAATTAEERTRQELVQTYTRLAELVAERVQGAPAQGTPLKGGHDDAA